MSNEGKILSPAEEKSILKKIFWRSWAVGAAYNNVRGQGHGCVYSLYPLINALYPDPEDKDRKIEAIKRHEVFYNITPQVNTVGLGLFAGLEERIAADPSFDASSVNALKASIMGPASGIGDAMFQTTIRLIAASIGLGLAQNGSALGGVLFFLIFNACSWAARAFLLNFSFNSGEKLIESTEESGLLGMLTNAASIIGLFMIGAMIANTVKLSFGLSWEVAGGEVTLQSFFDAVMPCFLPLVASLLIAWLLRVKKVDANLLMILIIVVSILGAWVGLF